MGHTCTIPKDLKVDKNGTPSYVRCGLPASYKVGDWYVCAGHKKYYTDMEGWPAELIEGSDNK